MTRCFLVLGACLAGACASPAPLPGTFVGNPSLQARIADNAVQQVTSGVFEALEVHTRGCDDTIEQLGPTVLRFEGAASEDRVTLPIGEHCALFFVVDQFVVRFDDGGAPITLVADDFDLSIASEFVARRGEDVVLRFGDRTWLAELAALAPPGETRLGADHPALTRTFFHGLFEGSEIGNFN